MIISLTPEPSQGEVLHVIVLCSECKTATITVEPKIGTAKHWDGIMICKKCGDNRRAAMRKL